MSFPTYGASAGSSGASPAPGGGSGGSATGGAQGGMAPVIPLRPGQPASAASSGGGAADQILQQTVHQLQQMQAAAQQSDQRYHQLLGQHNQQQELLDRLRGVFAPPAQQTPEDTTAGEIAETERILEYYIAQGFEHEKAGNPIPLTIDSAIRGLQDRMRFLKTTSELTAKNAKLEQAIRSLADEGFQLDRNAQSVLGTSLIGAIETIYGPGQENTAQKRAMWGAVNSLMGQELQALRQSNPQAWDRIRRDPAKLSKLAHHFVEQTIPPRARELLQMHNIQSTPLSEADFWAAFQEARQIQDPRQREQLTTKIRQDLLAHRFSRSGARQMAPQQPGPTRPNLATLYGRGANPAPQGQRPSGFRISG